MTRLYDKPLLRWYLLFIAAFYAYGAAVHVANMASLTGFDWLAAPRLWQALDVVYLVLDVAVVVGLLLRHASGLYAFIVAATSQIILYTVFRDDVAMLGTSHALEPEQMAYLSTLVMFHIVTLVALALLAVFAPARQLDA
ncbi:hypothetical protein BN1012_Phect248 [Candidatus Phaeomarinobacter ectocarpi]|uniref:Uncharacterized protein n=1 Tax=Candidatus Phaeomarinibacter ectocarpi TaxID=1458461 RepID=X5MBS3_9HYPH|nr:hypothetical protein [Candidatus Phaeomarinobacter ectocarpi]CDO58462.1 hypothetical protein BN1012_Phect248 [Candidatus Phaeomarinobacter ectocarpi]